MTSVPEIARRLIDGVWQTGVAEDSGGGSQPGTPVVYGPFTVTFADFSGGDGDRTDIVTFPVGTLVLNWWIDPATFSDWHSAAESGDGSMVQGTGSDVNAGLGVWGEPFPTGVMAVPYHHNLGADIAGLAVTALDGTQYPHNTSLPLFVLDTAPVQGQWVGNGDPAPTAGRSDLYFLAVVPPFDPSP